MFEGIKLQNKMVYSFDDESIADIKSKIDSRLSSCFIILNASHNQKRNNSDGTSSNMIIMSKIFEKTITVLAQVLVD